MAKAEGGTTGTPSHAEPGRDPWGDIIPDAAALAHPARAAALGLPSFRNGM